MNASGLLISCATPALRSPIDANFSDCESMARIFCRSAWSRIDPTNWIPSAVSIVESESSSGNVSPFFRRPSNSTVWPTRSGSCAPDDLLQVLAAIREKHLEGLAEDLARLVPERPLGRGVEEGDAGIGVGGNHGIQQPLRELPISLFRLAQLAILLLHLAGVRRLGLDEASPRCLQGLALGDVADHGEDDPLILQVDRGRVDVHGEDAAVLGAVPAFAVEMPLGELLLQPLAIAGRELGIVDVARVELQEFLASIAQPSRGGGVGVEDLAVEVVDKYRILDPLEKRHAHDVPRRPARRVPRLHPTRPRGACRGQRSTGCSSDQIPSG